MKHKKGFTLIELLVVIAIIGLLSTLAVVSLNSTRGKARDAQRVSDVKQLSTLIEMARANNGDGTVMTGCTTAGDIIGGGAASQCAGPDADILAQFPNFSDPTGTASCDGGATQSTAACDYTMGITGATYGNYELCFYLEQGAGGLATGVHRITEGSVLDTPDADCSYSSD